MLSLRSTWTVHEQRCRDLFGAQNALPKEGSLQLNTEYRWQDTETTWGTDAAQMTMTFPLTTQKLLPAGREDLKDPKTCEDFNAYIKRERPQNVYGTLPALRRDQQCPGLVQSSTRPENPIVWRCPRLLQSWSQALMVRSSEGYTPYCLEHETWEIHKERLTRQDAEFAKFREALQHQDASSAAETVAGLPPAEVPTPVASDASVKKRSTPTRRRGRSERGAPDRKGQGSARTRKTSLKVSQSEQNNTCVPALADEVAAATSQTGLGDITPLSSDPRVHPSTSLFNPAVPPPSTSQATLVESAIPFDQDLQLPSHDTDFTSMLQSTEFSDLSDANYHWFLDPQTLAGQFDSNAYAEPDDMARLEPLPNDWGQQYGAGQSQRLESTSSAPCDDGETGQDHANPQAKWGF